MTGGRPAARRMRLTRSQSGQRLALREEVGPARDRRARREAVGGEEVGLGGVVDVGRVDEVRRGGRSAGAGPPGPGR